MSLIVVGKNLSISTEVDDEAQGLFCGGWRHVILWLIRESVPRRTVAGPFIENAPNMRRKRNIG